MASDFSAALKAHFGDSAPKEEAPSGDTYAQLASLITQVTAVADAPRTATLTSLGVSSLALVELTVRAEEHFGVRFDEGTVLAFDTVQDVVDYIDSQR